MIDDIDMLRRVVKKHISPYRLSDQYRDGRDRAFEDVLDWIDDPNALRDEAQKMGCLEPEDNTL